MSVYVRLSTAEVTTALERAVLARNERYVYPGWKNGCEYRSVRRNGREVNCVVGAVLGQLLPQDLWDLFLEDDNLNASRFRDTLVKLNTFYQVKIEIEERTLAALQTTQTAQDHGATWRSCLRQYRALT